MAPGVLILTGTIADTKRDPCRLADHLETYRKHHDERGNCFRQAKRRCETVFEGCCFLRLADLSAEAAAGWLTDRRGKPRKAGGIASQTFNHYIASLKAFGNWLVKTRRLHENPFRFMEKLNVEVDIQHERRPLDSVEFANLISTAKAGTPFRGLSGENRAALYFTAAATGLRASELASLTLASFDLDAETPTVTVAAGYSKHRREDVLPLHCELVAFLKGWFVGKPANAPLWPGKWSSRGEGAALIQQDMEAAGIEYRDAEGRVADFYALRHRFITEMAKAGVHPKDAMELARHSTITLTIDRYSHVEFWDSAAALSKFNLGTVVGAARSVELAATGTDNNVPLTPVSDKPRLRLKIDEKSESTPTESERYAKPIKSKPKVTIENDQPTEEEGFEASESMLDRHCHRAGLVAISP